MSTSSTRKHRRADLDVYVNKIIGDEPHLARVRDISESGLYLYKLLEPNVSDDSHVGLEIMLPNTRHVIWAVGKVVRNDESEVAHGAALEFTRIAESDREQIRRFVAELSDEPPPVSEALLSRAA